MTAPVALGGALDSLEKDFWISSGTYPGTCQQDRMSNTVMLVETLHSTLPRLAVSCKGLAAKKP
jgi:hypothetical protein